MKAVACEDGQLELIDLPEPQPAKGQVVLSVLSCGICGSDLHARHNADAQADVLAEAGYPDLMRSDQQVVMGHEFCGEVLEYGAGSRSKVPVGTAVVALPLRRLGDEVHAIGLSAKAPGGFAERVLVEEPLMFALPEGCPPSLAVLTEPLAIGRHAVRRSGIGKKDLAVVVGCGPVGLAVVAMLKARGVRTVVASDPAPGRRALATACGADIVVDPQVDAPYAAAGQRGFLTTFPALVELGISTMEKLSQLPVPAHHILRLADKLGIEPARPVVFECVGIPGMLDSIISSAPLMSCVVVVGVCMQPDTIRPAMAINKETDLRFVVGYTPLEFRDTLQLLAGGKLHIEPMLTGVVGLDEIDGAFAALATPDTHAKIVVDTRSTAVKPIAVGA